MRINGAVAATLDAGEVHEQTLTVSSVIDADEPVLVGQFATGSDFGGNPGDPLMMLIPPHEQFLNSYTVTTPATGFEQSYVNVVAPGDGSGITLDGTVVPASSFTAVGDSGFAAAAIPVAPGTHRLTAGRPFGLTVYGFNTDESYGYTAGLSLSEVARVIRVDLAPATSTAVVGEIACVTGTATDADDRPVAGVRMDFAVAGSNSTSGFALTDADGDAEYCYSGANAGDDTITGTVSDVSDTATKTWRAAPINRPPAAQAQSVQTDRDVPLNITLAGTDPDDDAPLTFTAAQPAHGVVSGSGATVTYTPAAGFTGADSFTFTVSDGQATSAPATVSITVTDVVPPDRPPVAVVRRHAAGGHPPRHRIVRRLGVDGRRNDRLVRVGLR